MKRTLAIIVGVAGITAAFCFGNHSAAQPGTATPPATKPVAAPAPLRTPVRIINMSHVVKNYNRWKNFQQEYKSIYQRDYEAKVEKMKTDLQAWTKHIENPKTADKDKETATKEIKRLQRDMQELSEDAKQKLGKMEMDKIVQIYKEIEDEVQRFAVANAIELVMHYNDAVEESDLRSPQNIHRKLGNGGCTPYFAAPGMDISNQILAQLNGKVPVAAAPAPGTGTQPVQYNPPPGTPRP